MQVSEREWRALLGPPLRASWPGPLTKLERAAERYGVDGHEYRELIRSAVQRRLRERGEAWERLDNRLGKRANGNGSYPW